MADFIPFADQAMFLAHIAGGQQAVMQILWRYFRPVDEAALSRFHDNLAEGPLSRLIRPARLPFGRHQWVRASVAAASFNYTAEPLPPERLMSWADAQVDLPLDPARGPPWTFTVQPFTDGSTAASLVISHCIADGLALAHAVGEAVRGEHRPIANHAPQGVAAALGAEILRSLKDTPATLKALTALARTPRPKSARPSTAPVAAGADNRTVPLPTAFVRVPTTVWDAKARSLGGNRFTLLAAMTASFAHALGRVRDGEITLMIPVNQREGAADGGGNQVSLAKHKLAVGEARGHLHSLQRRLQKTLLSTRREPDPLAEMLPLVPFVPRRAFAAAGRMALGVLADLPVTCSSLGTLPKDAMQIDGSDSDRLVFRGTDRRAAVRDLEQRQGVATLASGVMHDMMLLNFTAYQPGVVTQSHALRAMAKVLLADYGLEGTFFDD